MGRQAPDPRGYSGTPLPRKLGLKPGSRLRCFGAPAGFARTLGELPAGARRVRGLSDVIVVFARRRSELVRRFGVARVQLAERGALWIAWPKRTSGVATDLSEDGVRALGLGAGLVDYKVCAIDATWSGLCFARRRVTRPSA